jgi:pentatricopeptide repeat protein
MAFSLSLRKFVFLTLLLALRIECTVVYAFTFHTPPQRLVRRRTRLSSTGYDNLNKQQVKLKNDDGETNSARCVVPQNIPLDVLYEDSDLLVIHKPSGMVMQYVPGSVESAVVNYLNMTGGEAVQYKTPSWPWKSQDSFEGIVHRIDKETSGILVLAKHPFAASAVHSSFQDRQVNKTYLAIAVGLPTKETALEHFAAQEEAASAAQLLLLEDASRGTPKGTTTVPPENPRLKRLAKDIQKCGRDVDKALELFNDESFDPNVACFSSIISVCQRAEQRDKALFFFDSMKERGATPNTACFKKAISLCAKGNPPMYDKALELVADMKECKLPLDPHCVSSAISACGRAGQLEPALELLDRFLEETSSMDDDSGGVIGCFKSAISACGKCGATNEGLALKEKLRTLSGKVGAHEKEYTKAELLQSLSEDINVDAPIGKKGRLMAILPNGRDARSIVSPLDFNGALSLNRVEILTGRTHQIRVHMASVLGCPLVGDGLYNRDDPIKRSGVERCMLHAAELTLPHPITGAILKITCPPPSDFAALADVIRGSSISMIPHQD